MFQREGMVTAVEAREKAQMCWGRMAEREWRGSIWR